jgi:prepilin-type N-terminal cleavage/methylation domain-containing protein
MHLPPDTVPPSHLQPSAFSLQPYSVKPRRGFTLLELLVVISMMIFITTIAVMNYFGAMRTAGYNAVSNDVFNALLMARQRACLDNKPVYVYLIDTTNYVLLESFGTAAIVETDLSAPSGPGKILYDQYNDVSGFVSNSIIVDIDNLGTGAIAWSTGTAHSPTNTFFINGDGTPVLNTLNYSTIYVTNNPACNNFNWKSGDRYGVTVFAPQMLPKGFEFVTPSTPGQSIVFNPDGTVNAGVSSLVVQETLKNDTTHQITFTVKSNGSILQSSP